MPLKDDVDQLKAELAQLTLQHLSQQSSLSRQLAEFSAKLDSISLQLEQQDAGHLSNSITHVTAPLSAADIESRVQTVSQQSEALATPLQPQTPETNPWQDDPWQRQTTHPQEAHSRLDSQQVGDREFTQPAGIEVGVQAASQFESLLSQGLAAIVAPFAAITEQVKGFYQHYQAKGLGPVFLNGCRHHYPHPRFWLFTAIFHQSLVFRAR